MVTKLRLACSAFVILCSLIGCNERSSETAASVGSDSDQNHSLLSRVYYEEAVLADIVAHKTECPGGANPNHPKVCIQICHVPPGNPAAKHDKVLPLSAMKAHLGHYDYLGLCDGETAEETPADDPAEEENPDPGSGGGGSEEPPLWCEPYFSVDVDCDGIDDDTETPYL